MEHSKYLAPGLPGKKFYRNIAYSDCCSDSNLPFVSSLSRFEVDESKSKSPVAQRNRDGVFKLCVYKVTIIAISMVILSLVFQVYNCRDQ